MKLQRRSEKKYISGAWMLTKMSRAELEKRIGKLRGHVMDDSIDPGIFCAAWI